MRTLIMLAAAAGISGLTAGVSAAPLTAPPNAIVQKTDWYCGPNCQRHHYWQNRRAERREEWRESRRISSPLLLRKPILSRLLILALGRGCCPAIRLNQGADRHADEINLSRCAK